MDPRLSDDLTRRARQLSEFFARRATPHAFIGGLAMNVWTIPLPTYDIDLVAGLGVDDVKEVLKGLEALGFVPPPTTWLESVGAQRFREFTVHWPFELGLRAADIYLSLDPFQSEALRRRRRVEMEPGFSAEVVMPEDLLVYKLLAWRPKDRAAIDRLLAIQRTLDWSYVRRWVDGFGIVDRFEAALREAGLPQPPQ